MIFNVRTKSVSGKIKFVCEVCEKREADKLMVFTLQSRVHVEFEMYLCNECNSEMRKDTK